VYLARLDDRQVAIKRASDVSFQGIKEFRNELMLLGRLHHRHLVRLEGFCDDKDEQVFSFLFSALCTATIHFQRHSSLMFLVMYMLDFELTGSQVRNSLPLNIDFAVDSRL
jgi:hypothetical protein